MEFYSQKSKWIKNIWNFLSQRYGKFCNIFLANFIKHMLHKHLVSEWGLNSKNWAVCNVKSKGSDFQNWLLISHDVVLPAQCACTTLVFWVFNLFSEVLELDLLVAWWCSYPYLVFWNRACIIVMDWVPKMCFENSGQKTNDHMTKICQKWRKAFFNLPLKEHFSADIRKSNSKYLIFHH